MTTATSKSLSEMDLGELVQRDIEIADRMERQNLSSEQIRHYLRRRREIRAEIDARKAQQS